ncbi:MAG: anti-sigma regulatory factor, partial [Gammaproteobacteria bacterium]|nr:anti-sigma regulatory factor [Gammaproteobacteria bacterium]NIQ75485.1 anti-sigma regulatory factor [Gammaproteobacteria bacterium]
MTARYLAAEAGFNETNQFLIATAASELATNIVKYAKEGEVI